MSTIDTKHGHGHGHGGDSPNQNQNQNPIAARIPLDAKQAYRLKSSWKAVHRKLQDAGVMIFLKIVRESPQVLPAYNCIYAKCGTADPATLGADEEFNRLALQYMQQVDEVMQNFDSPNDLLRHLATVADLHRPDRQSIAKHHLHTFVQPFMESMRSILEDRFNEQIEDIYQKAVVFFVSETETLVHAAP